jgi:hypothetical protein
MRGLYVGLVSSGLLVCASCNEPSRLEVYEKFENRLAKAYRSKPSAYDRPYALMTTNWIGTSWLLTVHGLPDNRKACEEIAEPYNADPRLSVVRGAKYFCVAVDGGFDPTKG